MILHWHVHSKDTYQFCAVQNWHHQHLLNAGFTQKDSAALGAFTGEFVSYVCVNIEKALLIYLLLQHGSFEGMRICSISSLCCSSLCGRFAGSGSPSPSCHNLLGAYAARAASSVSSGLIWKKTHISSLKSVVTALTLFPSSSLTFSTEPIDCSALLRAANSSSRSFAARRAEWERSYNLAFSILTVTICAIVSNTCISSGCYACGCLLVMLIVPITRVNIFIGSSRNDSARRWSPQ